MNNQDYISKMEEIKKKKGCLIPSHRNTKLSLFCFDKKY